MTLFAQWSNRVCYISLCEINDLLEFFSLTNVKFPLSCQSLDLVWVLTECSLKSLQRLTHNTQSMVLFSSQFFFLLQYILSLFGHYWINAFLFIFYSNIGKVMEIFIEDFFIVSFTMTFGLLHYSYYSQQGNLTANNKDVFTAATSWDKFKNYVFLCKMSVCFLQKN